MQTSNLEQDLEQVSGSLLYKLRFFKGLDQIEFARLLEIVDHCAKEFASTPNIPKSVASIFFDIYPAIDSASYSYEPELRSRIQQAADTLADHIRSCFL